MPRKKALKKEELEFQESPKSVPHGALSPVMCALFPPELSPIPAELADKSWIKVQFRDNLNKAATFQKRSKKIKSTNYKKDSVVKNNCSSIQVRSFNHKLLNYKSLVFEGNPKKSPISLFDEDDVYDDCSTIENEVSFYEKDVDDAGSVEGCSGEAGANSVIRNKKNNAAELIDSETVGIVFNKKILKNSGDYTSLKSNSETSPSLLSFKPEKSISVSECFNKYKSVKCVNSEIEDSSLSNDHQKSKTNLKNNATIVKTINNTNSTALNNTTIKPLNNTSDKITTYFSCKKKSNKSNTTINNKRICNNNVQNQVYSQEESNSLNHPTLPSTPTSQTLPKNSSSSKTMLRSPIKTRSSKIHSKNSISSSSILPSTSTIYTALFSSSSTTSTAISSSLTVISSSLTPISPSLATNSNPSQSSYFPNSPSTPNPLTIYLPSLQLSPLKSSDNSSCSFRRKFFKGGNDNVGGSGCNYFVGGCSSSSGCNNIGCSGGESVCRGGGCSSVESVRSNNYIIDGNINHKNNFNNNYHCDNNNNTNLTSSKNKNIKTKKKINIFSSLALTQPANQTLPPSIILAPNTPECHYTRTVRQFQLALIGRYIDR